MQPIWIWVGLLLVPGLCAAAPIPVDTVQRSQPVVFESEILPLLQKNCLACHSQTEKQGDLVLETAQGILKGGDSGPAVVPGQGANSLLLKVAAHQMDPIMPPEGNDVAAKPLTSQELGLLKLWIDQGARGGTGTTLSPAKWQTIAKALGPVMTVALSPDGQYVACSRANQLFLYHVPTGRLVTRLSDPALATNGVDPGLAHRDLVQSLALSPNGDWLASGSFREVKLWRRPSDVVQTTLAAEAEVSALSVSPDKRWIATSGPNHSIRIWNAQTGAAAVNLIGHTDKVTSLRFSADGAKLLSGSLDQTLRIWNTADGSFAGQIETPAAVHAVEWVALAAPTEQQPQPAEMIVSGGAENMLRTWTVPQVIPAKLASALPNSQRVVASRDGGLLAMSGPDGTVRVVSTADDKEVATWTLDKGPATALEFLPEAVAPAAANGSPVLPNLVTAGADGNLSVWKLPEHQLLARWNGGMFPVTALAAATDGKQLVSGLENGGLTLWSLAPPPLLTLEGNSGGPVNSLVVSPSRKLVAMAGVANGQPAVMVRNLDNGQLVVTLAGHTAPINTLAFAADNSRLVTGSADKTVRVWNLGNPGQPELHKVEGITAPATAVALSPDNTQILVGTAEPKLQLWNLADGMLVKEFAGHTGAITSVGYAPGNQPYSISADKSVRFWNPADGAQVRAFNDPATPTALALSPDGQKLALAGDDKLIRVYQFGNGQVLQTLTGHTAPANGVSFSADGVRLASVTAQGDLMVWDTVANRLLEATTDPNLTAAAFDFQLDRLLTGDKLGVLTQRPLRFARHLEGNTQGITAAVFHSNGQTVFTTCRDGAFRGYATANGQPTFATNHGAAVNALAIAPNEQVLATAGDNNVVRLWQTNGGGFGPQQLTGFPAAVKSVAFSGDGLKVMAGSAGDKPVALVFDLQSGLIEQQFRLHQQPLGFLSATGTTGFVLSADAVAVWRWSTHGIRQIPGHGAPVTSLAAIPNTSQQVMSGSQDTTIRRWNLENGQALGQYNHGGVVTAIDVRGDGQRLASVSDNHTAKLWNINGQQIAEMRGDVRRKTDVARRTQQQTAAQARVNAAKQLLDAAEKDLPVKTEADKKATEALAAANKDVTDKKAALDLAAAEKTAAEKGAIEASKVAQTATLAKLKAEADAKSATEGVTLAQTRLNQLTAAANAAPTNEVLKKAVTDATTVMQTAQTTAQTMAAAVQAPTQAAQAAAEAANQATQKVTQTQKPFSDALAALTTAQSAQNLAAQQQVIAARELEVAKGVVPISQQAVQSAEAALEQAKQVLEQANQLAQQADLAIRSVRFSPDGKLLATAGEYLNVHTWDAETGTPLAAFAGHTGPLWGVEFLSEGAIVSASSDQTARIWELSPGWKLERTLGGIDQAQLISHRVTALDFSPETDRLLVAGGTPSRNGELMIFQVADGAQVFNQPQAHDDVIYAARFSPDGRRIASAAADKYLRTFDVATQQMLRRFEGHTNYVLALAWKGDGSRLVSAGADNSIKVWVPETGDQLLTMPDFGRHVTAVRYLGETDNIVSSCGDKLVRMHNASNGGLFRNLGGATTWLHCVDATPDSNVVAGGTADGKLFLWNGNTGQPLPTITVGE